MSIWLIWAFGSWFQLRSHSQESWDPDSSWVLCLAGSLLLSFFLSLSLHSSSYFLSLSLSNKEKKQSSSSISQLLTVLTMLHPPHYFFIYLWHLCIITQQILFSSSFIDEQIEAQKVSHLPIVKSAHYLIGKQDLMLSWSDYKSHAFCLTRPFLEKNYSLYKRLL